MSKSIHIFGFHSIESLLSSNPESVLKVFIQSGRKDNRVHNLNQTLSDLKIPCLELDKYDLERIAKGETHQGIISEVILPPLLNNLVILYYLFLPMDIQSTCHLFLQHNNPV